jgi:TAG lipase/steryl ester hydrolase/phospholipase A2/LPA acyltransferase
MQAMAEMFNCNHFLVSQTNPHIVPLLNFKSMFPQKWASIMEAELKHRWDECDGGRIRSGAL